MSRRSACRKSLSRKSITVPRVYVPKVSVPKVIVPKVIVPKVSQRFESHCPEGQRAESHCPVPKVIVPKVRVQKVKPMSRKSVYRKSYHPMSPLRSAFEKGGSTVDAARHKHFSFASIFKQLIVKQRRWSVRDRTQPLSPTTVLKAQLTVMTCLQQRHRRFFAFSSSGYPFVHARCRLITYSSSWVGFCGFLGGLLLQQSAQ